jgi:hypothetical protein
VLREVEVSFLHFGLSVKNWAYNLFCHVRLPTNIRYVQQCLATRPKDGGEHKVHTAHGLDFTCDQFARLIDAQSYSRRPGEKPARIASWSKIGLLYACVKKFGTDAVQESLAKIDKASPLKS